MLKMRFTLSRSQLTNNSREREKKGKKNRSGLNRRVSGYFSDVSVCRSRCSRGVEWSDEAGHVNTRHQHNEPFLNVSIF